MRAFVVLLAISLAGCQTLPKSTKPKDQLLVRLVKEFETDTGVKVPIEDIYIVDKISGSSNVIGKCYRYPNIFFGYSMLSVVLDRKYWTESKIILKKALLYHELGHCLLSLDHDDSLDSNAMHKSLMHSLAPYPWESFYLELNWDRYVQELINK